MAISEQDKRAIDEAVKALHFVSTDEQGNKSIDPFYTDYRDTNEFLLQKAYDMRKAAFQPADAYEPENALIYTLQDMISEAYDESRWEIEDDILRKAGFDPSDDMATEQLEYLRETYLFVPPFDHYLDQTVRVNILLGIGNEANTDFAVIREQHDAFLTDMDPADAKEALAQESGLSFLIQQQGHTMEEFTAAMKAYVDAFYGENAGHNFDYSARFTEVGKEGNRFLTSVCQELDNVHNYMTCMTVLAKMSMYQFAEMMHPNKEVVIPKDAMVGIFCPWSGSGSVLEIELEKDLVIPSEKIWDVQIEGATLDNTYSVNSVFGLVDNCWEDIKEVREAQPEKKPALDSLIQSAQQKAETQNAKDIPAKEQER